MIKIFSIVLGSLVVHFVNGWTEPFLDVSLRAMLNLMVFIAVFMISKRYLKNFLE